jgi:hypothetical protein
VSAVWNSDAPFKFHEPVIVLVPEMPAETTLYPLTRYLFKAGSIDRALKIRCC